PMTPPLGKGPAALKQLVDTYMGAFPNGRCTVEEVISEGSNVVVRWTAKATHTGNLLHIAPTGKNVSVAGVDIYQFGNGKIQSIRIYWDAMGFAQQIEMGSKRSA